MGPNHHGSSPQSIGNNDRNSYGIIDRVVMMIVDHTHRANNTPTKADRITITTVVHILAIKVRVRTHHKIIRQETMIRIHRKTIPQETMIRIHRKIIPQETMIRIRPMHLKIIRQETMIRIHHETTPKEMIIMHPEIPLRGTMIMG